MSKFLETSYTITIAGTSKRTVVEIVDFETKTRASFDFDDPASYPEGSTLTLLKAIAEELIGVYREVSKQRTSK